jgi:hypothetical protein
MARFFALQGATYLSDFQVLVQPTLDRPGRYSDHKPFSEAGIPAVRLIEAVEDTARQHSGDDLPETISPAYLRRATQLALASLVNLADGPPPPPAPVLRAPNTLTWSPVEGAAGYVLAFRRLDSLAVDEVVRLGAVTSLTWDAIADSRFGSVSVAAVDSEGLLSAFSPEFALPG